MEVFFTTLLAILVGYYVGWTNYSAVAKRTRKELNSQLVNIWAKTNVLCARMDPEMTDELQPESIDKLHKRCAAICHLLHDAIEFNRNELVGK